MSLPRGPRGRQAPDVVVVGLGAMGSLTLLALARRGLRVVGIDQYRPPHIHGSSHGRSRIIREAYYESPAYVPLVRRAWERWQALERESGRVLLRQTGGLMIGAPEGTLVRGVLRSAEAHRIPVEVLDRDAVRHRFPALAPPPGHVGVLEPNAGILDPETCIETALLLAGRTGADCRFETRVTGWRSRSGGLEVATSSGPISCGCLVLSAGPWLPGLVPAAALPLSLERQMFAWFETLDQPRFAPERLPVFLWERAPDRILYGFPDEGAGFKAAIHHEGVIVPGIGSLSRGIEPEEIESLRDQLRELVPTGWGAVREARVCPYTNTPDRHFVIGEHPDNPRVLLVSACSGHGFKFASAVGELVADLAGGAAPPTEFGLFAPARFARDG